MSWRKADAEAIEEAEEAEQAATAEASERRRLQDEVRRLRGLLNERDEFIVNNNLWHKFTSEL